MFQIQHAMKKFRLLSIALWISMQPLYAQIEPTAGNWKTWFIPSGNALRLPPPPGAAATAAELKEVRAAQARADSGTWQQMLYWNAGAPSYRWRDVFFSLSDNDTTQPRPFVNMLLNVAVYDATVAAWETKYAYKRKRPFFQDAAVKTYFVKPESPSYPCEHSVAAGVTVALVSHFYPQKRDSVYKLAQDAMESRIAAGVVYPSDTKAGFELGQKVAEQVLAQTKGCAPTAQWDGKIPGEPGMWKGKNPMGPMIGSWKPVVLLSGKQLRPPPPPDYKNEMDELRNFKPTFRSTANAYYYASQDFWRDLTERKLWEYNLHLNPPRAARIYALRSIAVYDGFIACWDAKYAYWGTRPDQYDTTYHPVLMRTPNFPGYPSGHATMDGMSAALMSYFFPAEREFFWQKAKEAAESRFEGGVHFRTDNEVGLKMGKELAEMVLSRARVDGADQVSKQVAKK
jgi:membrane-associated phospholipid phosphatase